MKKLSLLFAAFLLLASCHNGGDNPKPDDSQVLAFPHAEGGGKYTKGGRGAVVYHVTNLEDSDKTPGCLRYILKQPGSKTVVFDTCGVIRLTRQLEITEGMLTIAGQTAPGEGICIAGYPVVVKTSNVIIRFVHFRMGDLNGVEGDALSINSRKNIIVDHCSFSWSTDECVSCYGNTDFTLQYCFITESLNNSVHGKGTHGYGGIWGGTNASFHHNLLAHHNSRNPRFDHDYTDATSRGPVDFVNNVVYNWGSNSAYGGEGTGTPHQINFENNFFKPGPASSHRTRLLNPTTTCSNCGSSVTPGKFYVAGNKMDGSGDVTSDNWKGVEPDDSSKKSACKADKRWTDGMTLLSKVQTAEEAFETVLQKAGASLVRDAIDARIVSEVRNGTSTYNGSNGSKNGLIDTPEDVKKDAGTSDGWPLYKMGTRPADSDGDGMPDEWETANGLDPHSVLDNKKYDLSKQYTNLEVYLNSLVEHLY